MRHRHVTRSLLLAARRGEISYRELAETLLERLGQVCSGCREEAEAARASEIPLAAYHGPVTRALHVGDRLRRFQAERADAPELLELLQGLSPEQRLLRIQNSPRRFGNPALAEALVEEARSCLPHDPAGSLAWARALEAVAGACRPPYAAHRVLAVAYQGNAHRAAGDFRRGEELLRRARDLMTAHGVSDPEVDAELHSLFGSLCSDLGRFDESLEHLEGAARLYEALDEPKRLARVLMKLGMLHRLLDDLPAALRADKAALGLLSPVDDRRLYLAARVNYAYHLAEAGKPLTARDVLDWDADLFRQHADPHTRVRVDWLQARLAGELGDPAGAESGLLAVRDEVARQGQGFHAALVCLDLAALYHEEGRVRELQETAAQAVELFRAHAIHREALAALVLLRDAARSHTLSAETIARIARFVEQARRDPTARLGDEG